MIADVSLSLTQISAGHICIDYDAKILICSLLEPLLYTPTLLKDFLFCQQRSEQEQLPGENVQPSIDTSSEHGDLALQLLTVALHQLLQKIVMLRKFLRVNVLIHQGGLPTSDDGQCVFPL